VHAAAGQTELVAPGVRRTVLPSGLRVVTERIEGVRSAAYGVWLDVGARDERPELGGVSHFLEHLLFKGTQRRSALDIATAVDAVGGEMNAWTGQEQTCYYARVLDTDLPLAVDVVTDMVTGSLIRSEDVDSERTVVLEEIAMRDDEPADAVAELLSATLFAGHALGRPITGTVATMTAMRRDDIYEFWRERYLPSRAVVTAAGRLDHQQVVELAAACFDTAMPGPGSGAPEPLRPGARGFGAPAPAMRLGEAVIQVRPTEQANVMIGTAGLPLRDERRYVLTVLSTLLGGGMSSRLFQEVREKRGLAYTVQTSVDGYSDTGVFSVYAGAAPERIPELLDVVHAELGAAARGEISDEEVERAKGQVRGGIVIGLEDTGSRMGRLGRGELSYGEIPAIEELLDRVAVVTPGAVRDLAAEILGAPRTVALLGPDDTAEIPLDTYRNAG